MAATSAILGAFYRANGQFIRLQFSHETVSSELAELVQLGYAFEAHPHFGHRLVSSPDRLIADDLQARLMVAGTPGCIGSEIVVFEETTSTNDVIARLLPSRASEGVVVFAESQTRGGDDTGGPGFPRVGRGLWFSVLLRPQFPLPRLTVAASVALARVLRTTGIEARIKWPNDVTVNRRKVSGILMETRDGAAVLGIGINVNCRLADFPVELQESATSLERESGQALDRPALAVRLLTELNVVYQQAADQFDSISVEWARLCTTLGKQIAVRMGDRRIEGHAQALDEDGTLLIRLDNGRTERVLGADLTLERE